MLDKNKDEKVLNEKLDKLIYILDKRNVEELIYILGNKKQIIIRSFISGIAKGIGGGIGFTILTAILIYFLQRIIRFNIPLIGQYISDIVDIVEQTK